MSISEPSKATKSQNESANSDATNQENPYYAIDMDLVKSETVTPGAITLAKSKDYLCVDIIENSTEPPTDRNEEIVSENNVNITELRVHIIGQRSTRRKFTLKGIYDSMVRFGKPPQLLRQEQPAPQPQQFFREQYSPTQCQGPRQAQGYPQGSKSAGYPSSVGQQQVYQQSGYPQQQGFFSQQGYPQQQENTQQQRFGQGFLRIPPMTGPPLDYDPKTRNSFVRLVMILVLVMLLTTALFVAFVYTNFQMKLFFLEAGWMILIPAIVLLVGAQCTLMCSPCGRVPPCNIICLIIGVCAMSLITARITVFYRTEIIMYALIATAAVVAVCVMLSFSKFDFTSYMLYIIGIATAFGVIVMIISIVSLVTGNMMKPLFIILLIVGTIIQVVVLSMELQMVLGGKTVELSEDDYAVGAFMIYTSIVDIFIKMVQLLGLLDSM